MAMRSQKVVYGYIRTNFERRYLIEGIMEIIIAFHMNNSGPLYAFGDLKHCLEIGKERSKDSSHSSLYLINNDARQVAVGKHHTLILDVDYKIWAFGDNDFGQLGYRDDVKSVIKMPKKVPIAHPVVSICVGDFYSLILLQNGWVQSFGSTAFGASGHGMIAPKLLAPKTIEALKPHKIIQISAGAIHSAALTEDGDLFCFGANCFGQCGVGEDKGNMILTPTKVEMHDKIAVIECGEGHTLLITRNGLMYSFGASEFGKLGHGTAGENKWTPTLIEALKEKQIKTCAAGYDHSLCVDEDGIIWSFGSNREGQGGFSSGINHHTIPEKIEWFIENDIKAECCAAGGNRSCVIGENGNLYVFGNNFQYDPLIKHQLNCFESRNISMPNDSLAIKASIGEKYTAVICNSD